MEKTNWKEKIMSKDFAIFVVSLVISLISLFYLLSYTGLFIENMRINLKADENIIFILFILSACFSIYSLIKTFVKTC